MRGISGDFNPAHAHINQDYIASKNHEDSNN